MAHNLAASLATVKTEKNKSETEKQEDNGDTSGSIEHRTVLGKYTGLTEQNVSEEEQKKSNSSSSSDPKGSAGMGMGLNAFDKILPRPQPSDDDTFVYPYLSEQSQQPQLFDDTLSSFNKRKKVLQKQGYKRKRTGPAQATRLKTMMEDMKQKDEHITESEKKVACYKAAAEQNVNEFTSYARRLCEEGLALQINFFKCVFELKDVSDEVSVLSAQLEWRLVDMAKKQQCLDSIISWQSKFKPIPANVHTMEQKGIDQLGTSIQYVRDNIKRANDDIKRISQEIDELTIDAQEIERYNLPAFKNGDNFVPWRKLINRLEDLSEEAEEKLLDLQSIDESSIKSCIEEPITRKHFLINFVSRIDKAIRMFRHQISVINAVHENIVFSGAFELESTCFWLEKYVNSRKGI